MYRTIFCLFILVIQSLAYGENALPLSNTDGGSHSIVNNCVSVISGDYMESSCDLILKGPETLVFERFYSSSDSGNEDLFFGWRHNHHSTIQTECPPQTNEISADYISKEGRTARDCQLNCVNDEFIQYLRT